MYALLHLFALSWWRHPAQNLFASYYFSNYAQSITSEFRHGEYIKYFY